MTTINRSALLPYPNQNVFALVADIESYPGFMDGCVGAEILHRSDDAIEARLDLARAGIAQSFATRNRIQPFHTIELELLEGPFEKFNGRWQFQALGEMACKVSLDLEFKFSNALLGVAAGRLFDTVTSNLVDALSQRARQLYG
jgi:ribosome-associated toxin RatA of RatAB toxin-antitoxin module